MDASQLEHEAGLCVGLAFGLAELILAAAATTDALDGCFDGSSEADVC